MGEASAEIPSYIQNRPDKEGLRWAGADSSLDILPHFRTNWRQLSEASQQTGKPIGDMGGSFSAIPAEGELRGIRVLPIDIMHEHNLRNFDYETSVIDNFLADRLLTDLYRGIDQHLSLPGMEVSKRFDYSRMYEDQLTPDLKKAVASVRANLIAADLAKIPLADRALAVSLVHDSVPKHSASFDVFVDEQLPEILRVTDEIAYVFPLVMTKTVRYQKERKYDEENDEEYYDWVIAQHHDEYALESGWQREVLDVVKDIASDPDALMAIQRKAAEMGFEFHTVKPLIRQMNNTSWRVDNEQMGGVFKRKKQ